MACDLITVWTLDYTKKVTSFRSSSPSDVFLKLLETALETESALATPWTTALEEKDRRKSRIMGGGVDKKGSLVPPERGEDTDGNISKQEARRLKKEMRKREVSRTNCIIILSPCMHVVLTVVHNTANF